MAEVTRFFAGRRVIGVAAILGLLGAVGLGIGLWLDPRRALFAYLAAYATVTSVVVGALILLMIGYAANARWMAVVRRLHEAIVAGFVPLAVLFVPIALGLSELYVWADPDAVLTEHARHAVDAKRTYLEPVGFVIRAAIYFAIWIFTASLLRRWSRRRDLAAPPGGDPIDALARERALASVMLPAVGLAITFAGFDWLMSLQPTWFSSIFGVYVFAGGFLGGIALVAVLAHHGGRSGKLDGVVTPHHFHALGRLLLAFTVFWAYIAYFQGLLIQIANKPEEVTFFVDRLVGGWEVVLGFLVLGHFALPFALLLPRRPKFRSRYVAAVATWILVAHAVDVYWLVLPALGEALAPHWLDLAALAAVAGLTALWCAWRQRGVSLVADGDPMLRDGRRYASPT